MTDDPSGSSAAGLVHQLFEFFEILAHLPPLMRQDFSKLSRGVAIDHETWELQAWKVHPKHPSLRDR